MSLNLFSVALVTRSSAHTKIVQNTLCDHWIQNSRFCTPHWSSSVDMQVERTSTYSVMPVSTFYCIFCSLTITDQQIASKRTTHSLQMCSY